MHLAQNDREMIKARELIEIKGAETLTLSDRRIYNKLIRNAHGPGLGDRQSTFEIRLADLRLGHKSNARLRESIQRLMWTNVVVLHGDKETFSVQLLGPNNHNDPARPHGRLTYTIWPQLADVLKRSMVFAKLSTDVLDAFRSSYAYALYEAIALRINRDKRDQEVPLSELRGHFLGVGEKKLPRFAQLRQTALDPAVAEVNALAPFNVAYLPIKSGRKVVGVHLHWRHKSIEERIMATNALRARLGSQHDMFNLLES